MTCTCSRAPLLAFYGVDEAGGLYVHQKAHRQDRIYAEVVITAGVAQIRCRDCLRWTKIRLNPRRGEVTASRSRGPKIVDESAGRQWLNPESPGK